MGIKFTNQWIALSWQTITDDYTKLYYHCKIDPHLSFNPKLNTDFAKGIGYVASSKQFNVTFLKKLSIFDHNVPLL